MHRLLLLLSVFVGLNIQAADPSPPREVVAISTGLVRLPKSTALKLNLTVAQPESEGMKRVFSKEDYRTLVQRLKSENEVEIIPLPRLVAATKKSAYVEIVKALRFPLEYRTDPAKPTLFIPDGIETRNLGVHLQAKPVIQSANTAYVEVETGLCRLLGYETPAGKLVRVSSPEDKTNWLHDLTKWQIPAGVASQPVTESSQGQAKLLLNHEQVLLMHGFTDYAERVSYFTISVEVLP